MEGWWQFVNRCTEVVGRCGVCCEYNEEQAGDCVGICG